jgi:hypothetical protein
MKAKELRVAVVPASALSDVDQSSDIDDIMADPNLKLYPITDFFKAQNDDELPESYFSFLINIETREDLTGSNIEGVHYF